jgi:hypothetical protein
MLLGMLCSQTLSPSPASAVDVRAPVSQPAAQWQVPDAAPEGSSVPLDLEDQNASEEREGSDDDDSDDDGDAQPHGSRIASHRLFPKQPVFGLHRLIARWNPVHLCLDPRPPRRA